MFVTGTHACVCAVVVGAVVSGALVGVVVGAGFVSGAFVVGTPVVSGVLSDAAEVVCTASSAGFSSPLSFSVSAVSDAFKWITSQ